MPEAIDAEIVDLCAALNLLPGIETISSCCGHGKDPIDIWFRAEGLEALPPLLYWFMTCHSGEVGWTVQARTDCGKAPVVFMVEGPAGAYEAGREIAKCIKEDLN